MIVLDASVAVKWFFPEAGSEEAFDLLERYEGQLAAPDLLVVEATAALARKANMDKTQRPGVLAILEDFHGRLEEGLLDLRRTSVAQARRAAEIATDLGHPLKDCIYLALALEAGCPLITADGKFASKVAGSTYQVRLLAS